jgi:molybdopterin-containing oxidoreductase family molybdopterin binding subunit
VGIHTDWEPYTPLVSWYPTPPMKENDPQYDLYCFSYRDILHTGSMTMEQPWLDEASQMNPYTYNITMNADTARRKGLKDGDIVWVENAMGHRQKGRLKLIEGQHPQTIAIAACSGHWIDALPIAKGKGTNFDDLMPIDLAHVDPVSGNIEVSVKVKVYKEGAQI